tara:strand:+ start:11 stop:187 length:177 start_codon:yes stop_codon:yes gene_type:complete
MSKNKDTYSRKKGSDKQKKTFYKYGKYTSKGMRHLEFIKENSRIKQQLEKSTKNLKIE